MRYKGSDEWENRSDYAETFYKRAKGSLPEMESSKAVASLLAEKISEGDSILDVGCGAGHYLRSLLARVTKPFSYQGVDATPDFIEKALVAWGHQKNACFRVGDIYDLPFSDREFDIVMCNNVLLHLPSIVKPVLELLRVAQRFVLIRTLIGDRSFRVQEVYSKAFWPFSDIPVEREFDDCGDPVSYGFENIYSSGYFEAVIRRAHPDASVEFIKDSFFDPEAINRSANTEGLPNATRVIDGMQTLGYIITPWTFVFVGLQR